MEEVKMTNGIYWNPDREVWGLWVDDKWMVISVDQQDCVDCAISLGMTPTIKH